MQKTYMKKTADVSRSWHLVDVSDKILGDCASEIAFKLMGKHKTTYTPHIDDGDFVVVINAKEVAVTGSKVTDKQYFRYSGFPGGLKVETFEEMLKKYPERIIERAVYNMLPDNKLRQDRMKRLKVFAGAEHVHQAQLGAATPASEK